MSDRLYLVSDPIGRVDPYSTNTSQGLAVQRFVQRRARRPVSTAAAWMVWLGLWCRGYRIVYAPAIPHEDLTHGR
ncbi:hypothetical protein ACM26W_01140 [Halomonas sp. HK25]|uniref:hypothetical protein n=1 Tax=Halomonas sp. HK25 TaxID=3394321 RepID=UPI0039FCB53A